MSGIYRIERLILWMQFSSDQERQIGKRISALAKQECVFRWQYQDDRNRCRVSRFVDVHDSEELKNEIEVTQSLGMEPVVIFPHSDISWVNELGEYYLSLAPLFFDDNPIGIAKFIVNPSAELYESWSSVALKNSQSDITVDTSNQPLMECVADEFDRWLKSTIEWEQSLKKQLVNFSQSDFKESSNDWLEHRSTPLIRYKSSSPIEYFGCLPEQLERNETRRPTSKWAGTIADVFAAILSKQANLVGASDLDDQQTDGFKNILNLFHEIEDFEPNPLCLSDELEELRKNYPIIFSKITSIWTIATNSEKEGSVAAFISILEQLQSAAANMGETDTKWLKVEMKMEETAEVCFSCLIDFSSISKLSAKDVKRYEEGEITAYVQQDAFFPIKGAWISSFKLLDNDD